MNLIVIYGPPAVGKLTVANHLAKLTGYKVFHNHYSLDAVGSIIPMDHKDFWKEVGLIRNRMFELAAKNSINLIFTYCNGNKKGDYRFLRRIIRIVEKHKGKVKFVHLTCDKEQLYKRVKSASRENFDKMKSVKTLKNSLKKWDFYTSIPFVKSLKIDNTNLSAKKTAEKIKNLTAK